MFCVCVCEYHFKQGIVIDKVTSEQRPEGGKGEPSGGRAVWAQSTVSVNALWWGILGMFNSKGASEAATE